MVSRPQIMPARLGRVVTLGQLLVQPLQQRPFSIAQLRVDNRKSVEQEGIQLTVAEAKGRDLFAARCTQCHTLAASNANATVGPDLDTLKPPKGLVLDAINNGRARGNGQMPAQLYTGQEAQDVAAYVAKVAGAGA